MGKTQSKTPQTEELSQTLNYYCNVCKKSFKALENKKGSHSREVFHCSQPAFYRGKE